MEAGEGASKLSIGFLFVTKMGDVRASQWFGISGKCIAVSRWKRLGGFVNERGFCFNLSWNILRESAETGCFVSIEDFLSDEARRTLTASVVTGVFAAFPVSVKNFYWNITGCLAHAPVIRTWFSGAHAVIVQSKVSTVAISSLISKMSREYKLIPVGDVFWCSLSSLMSSFSLDAACCISYTGM